MIIVQIKRGRMGREVLFVRLRETEILQSKFLQFKQSKGNKKI